MTRTFHPLGRIGGLADAVASGARGVLKDMVITPGEDAYTYQGTTEAVNLLKEALADLDHYFEGWR
jgi:hypothetical protein